MIPRLSPERLAYYKSQMVTQGIPVRFFYKGKALDIVRGTTYRSNVLYHPTYWNFTRATAREIAAELGVTLEFDKLIEV